MCLTAPFYSTSKYPTVIYCAQSAGCSSRCFQAIPPSVSSTTHCQSFCESSLIRLLFSVANGETWQSLLRTLHIPLYFQTVPCYACICKKQLLLTSTQPSSALPHLCGNTHVLLQSPLRTLQPAHRDACITSLKRLHLALHRLAGKSWTGQQHFQYNDDVLVHWHKHVLLVVVSCNVRNFAAA